MRKYVRVSENERRTIEILYNRGMSVRNIAKAIGRAYSGVYYELRKGYYRHLNTDYTTSRKYSSQKAQNETSYRNTAKGVDLKVGNDMEYILFVEKMIMQNKYSPQAVIGYIAKNKLLFKTDIKSYTTLYSYIDKGVFPNLTDKDLLRRKPKKQKVEKKEHKSPRGTSIELRPATILSRMEFGHWEMDTVIGKREKGETLLVLTERKTRYEIILRCRDKTAKSVVKHINGLERKYGSLFPYIFKSITVDNGVEFSAYKAMERRKRTKVYYCHPYSSWERGSNENQNAFIRRFIPKGTKIETVTDERIAEIQEYINTYPRLLFKFDNSKTLFLEEIDKLLKTLKICANKY